jgi:hypothetical protein
MVMKGKKIKLKGKKLHPETHQKYAIFGGNDLFSMVFGCRNYSAKNKTYFQRLPPKHSCTFGG